MPRLKPTPHEEANCIVRACISGNMERQRFNEDHLAMKLGVTKRTVQNKRNNPGTFTLDELQSMAKMLKFTPIQAASIVLGRDLTKKELRDFIMM